MGNRGSDARRRALKKKLLKRDKVCYYCLLPLDPTKKFPDPWSVEIDEILPSSLGGDTLSEDNTRLVHRCCNIHRSNDTSDAIFEGCFRAWALAKLGLTQDSGVIWLSSRW